MANRKPAKADKKHNHRRKRKSEAEKSSRQPGARRCLGLTCDIYFVPKDRTRDWFCNDCRKDLDRRPGVRESSDPFPDDGRSRSFE